MWYIGRSSMMSDKDLVNDCISRQDSVKTMYDLCEHIDQESLHIDVIVDALENLPTAEPKIIHCKDCRNRDGDECPMRHVEWVEWEEDGYIEVDDIVHDYTEPHGYCDKGERNE